MKLSSLTHLFYFGIVLAFTSCSSNNDEPAVQAELTAETRNNVSYGTKPQQIYDLYLPAGRSASSTKVIVLVHGGGWTGGDKNDMTAFITLIQANLPQYAIVNMNYVLASFPSATAFPDQFEDVGRALASLVSERNNLQILPEFALIGASAGAHISLMYDSVYDTADEVKMVCDIVGPSDFTDPFYADNPNFNLLLTAFVDESAYPPNTNYAQATSPVYQINSHTSPTLMFYGDQDPLVPIANGESLDVALSNAQITHSFTVYPGGHGDNWSQESLVNLNMQLVAFVKEHLPL